MVLRFNCVPRMGFKACLHSLSQDKWAYLYLQKNRKAQHSKGYDIGFV